MRFSIHRDGVKVAEQPTITVAFDHARSLADSGGLIEVFDGRVDQKVRAWAYTPARGFLPKKPVDNA